MFQKQAFTVNIGANGTVASLHLGKKVQHKIFIAELNDETKKELEKLFNANKSASIYILLDNSDQNYKKKLYPAVRKSDLQHLIDRDLKKEFIGDVRTFKKALIAKDKASKKWDCVLVASTYSQEVEQWIDFLLAMPNHLEGIYMLPVESINLSQMILDAEKRAPSNITIFIVQNKISGIRQIIFSNRAIIFTRLVNYQFDDPRFIEEFEQDIFRTNEYLKRIFPELKLQDINIINILPEELISKLNEINDKQFNFINYTPYQAAQKIGFGDIITQNSKFSDILISNVFVNSKKKILKFITPKINLLERLYLVINSLKIFNIILAILICAFLINIFVYSNLFENKVSNLMAEKSNFEHFLKKAKSLAFDNEDDATVLPIEEIMDFGRLNDGLVKNNSQILEIFKKLKIFSNHSASVKYFSYALPSYDKRNNTPALRPTLKISGAINTPSGDIEDLFKQYDGLSLAVRSAFPNHIITFSELPKDIDFSKKYYNFSFELNITSK